MHDRKHFQHSTPLTRVFCSYMAYSKLCTAQIQNYICSAQIVINSLNKDVSNRKITCIQNFV